MKEFEDLNKTYKEGFSTDVDSFSLPPGLDEGVVKSISSMKNEPEWLLDFRLKAFEHWKNSVEPTWAELDYKPIDYQSISYYSAPKKFSKDEIPQEIFDTFEKLGVPLHERNALLGIEEPDPNRIPTVAIDAVFDSVSVATTFKKELEKHGIIFCSISEAIENHEDLVRQYLGTVIPYKDNYFATLNSAVFTAVSYTHLRAHETDS